MSVLWLKSCCTRELAILRRKLREDLKEVISWEAFRKVDRIWSFSACSFCNFCMNLLSVLEMFYASSYFLYVYFNNVALQDLVNPSPFSPSLKTIYSYYYSGIL